MLVSFENEISYRCQLRAGERELESGDITSSLSHSKAGAPKALLAATSQESGF